MGIVRTWRRFVAALGGVDLAVLLTVLASSAGAWAFVAVAHAVNAGSTQSFDETLLRAMRDPNDPAHGRGPEWLEEFMRDLSAFGGIAGLCLLTASISGYLAISRKYHALTLLLVATLGGWLLSSVLKTLFDRRRPEVVPYLAHVSTSSFPSGHSMLSAVVYLTLGSLLARFVRKRRLKLYFLSVALLLTFLVGVSRVYVGVHWPTDVLAGWSAGLAWALGCSLAARWLQRHGAVEEGAG
jgi:undecaprenyl-diphosphatase